MNIAEYASLRQTAYERLQQAHPGQPITHNELVREIQKILSSAS
jgi:hypothetical protein